MMNWLPVAAITQCFWLGSLTEYSICLHSFRCYFTEISVVMWSSRVSKERIPVFIDRFIDPNIFSLFLSSTWLCFISPWLYPQTLASSLFLTLPPTSLFFFSLPRIVPYAFHPPASASPGLCVQVETPFKIKPATQVWGIGIQTPYWWGRIFNLWQRDVERQR